MSDSITLHGYANDGLSLAEALEASLPTLGQQETIALLYSPGDCALARLEGSELRDCEGRPLVLSSFYEARIFNEAVELRWLNSESGRCRGVLLSESAIDPSRRAHLTQDVSLRNLEPLRQTYLLWGKGVRRQSNTGLAAGWSRLTTARIGELNVPIVVPDAPDDDQDEAKQPRVLLKVREYLAECDHYGNVAVVEERLLKLEACNG